MGDEVCRTGEMLRDEVRRTTTRPGEPARLSCTTAAVGAVRLADLTKEDVRSTCVAPLTGNSALPETLLDGDVACNVSGIVSKTVLLSGEALD